MNWILVIVAVVIVYFVIRNKGKSKSKSESDDDHLEEYDINDDDSFETPTIEDYDKQSSLSKEATKLKKEGDLVGAIKKIDEAISIESDNTLVYKKAYYLQLDGKFDEAWNTMLNYTEIVNEALIQAKDWGELRATFLEYSNTLLSEAKLLKKEKRVKDYAYYCPNIEYCEFLAHATYPLIDFKKLLDEQKNGSISKRRKIKYKGVDLDKFDSVYREFIASNESEIVRLYNTSQSSDPHSHTRHLEYRKNTQHLDDEADDYYDKVREIRQESERKSVNAEKDAFKALKNSWPKGIALNNKCYETSLITK